MAESAAVSVVIPAYNEGPVIARGRRGARRSRSRGTRSSSLTTARAMIPATMRRSAGATVVRHPYNKGNGAAVKSGIRRATGEYVLIVDGDGQHSPDDARRIVARLGEYDLVIGARVDVDPGHAGAALRQRRAQPARELSDRTRDPGSDVGIPRRAPRVPARVPAPPAERLLDADDDDAGIHQGGLQRGVRADRSTPTHRATRKSDLRATARSSSSSSSRS